MAVKKPNFAVDLTHDGVNLWQRGQSDDWLGLGFVANSADNFTQAIDALRMEASQRGQNAAEIRIAKSEVYFTRIPSSQLPEDPTDQAILALIGGRIPFRDKSARVIVDTCRRGSGDLAVAVVPAPVLESAAAFARRHGFAPSYFTTLYNPMMFPAEPRFRLTEHIRPRPVLNPRPPRRRTMALVAGVALALAGIALVSGALLSPSQSAGVIAEADAIVSEALPVPATIVLPDLQLPQPGAIAAESALPTPAFAPDTAAPRPLPRGPERIAVAPDAAAPDIIGLRPRPHVQNDPVSPREALAAESGFEPSGLATRTRRLLDNSFISIEEPATGEVGRKTIRILPSDLGQGSFNRRFDARTYVRVVQANTANDAASGLPDVDNDLLRIDDTGVPLFEGPPDAVPPARPGTAAAEATSDTSLREFSAGISSILDTAGPDSAGIRVREASLETLRPRANPRRAQARPPAATSETETETETEIPVQSAAAAILRPKPRPDTLIRKIRQMQVDAAAELAAQEAIREFMPTANAVFVSLLPKPRPNHLNKSVTRSVPSLTNDQPGSMAVVRTAPVGGGKSTGPMTTSQTPKSVAALATDEARLPLNSLSLIGVFGTSSSRRALLRLRTGRYIKVKQGDDVGGWNVSAIGESSVRIKKGSRDEVLRMPE